MTHVWKPLESNPDAFNDYLNKIGVPDVKCYELYNFEDSIDFIAQPHYALILCFPNYKKVDELMKPIYEKAKADTANLIPKDFFFMKQKISNACGTFALFHAVSLNADKIEFPSDSLFLNWFKKAVLVGPEERSDLLRLDESMANAHSNCAQTGDTEIVEKVENHFVCYVNFNSTLYEVDSRMEFPRACGPTTPSTFLKDAGRVCLELTQKMDSIQFSAIALAGDSH